MLQSPSGHTASATIVYGGVLGLAWRGLRPAQGRAPLLSALLIAVVIGLTRIGLHAHTWPEVMAGGLAGCVGVAVLLRLAGQPPRSLRPLHLALVVVVLAALLHGAHLRAESEIQDWGKRLGWLLPGCAGGTAQARP